jgi:hypothetical protein
MNQKEITMPDTTLTLSADETTFLAEFLQAVLHDTRIEEHRTRTPSYRDHIVKREHMVEGLLKKLGQPAK